MNLKTKIKNALDSMKDGILNITREIQSTEKVESIQVRKDNKNFSSSSQTIIINGKHIFSSNNCISINVEGDVHSVDSQGSVTCQNVTGNIKTQGSVTCGDVGKNIDTQGSVRCGDVGGKIDTQGSVTCRDVDGSINTMGRVDANDVKGNIDTMGRVTINNKS